MDHAWLIFCVLLLIASACGLYFRFSDNKKIKSIIENQEGFTPRHIYIGRRGLVTVAIAIDGERHKVCIVNVGLDVKANSIIKIYSFNDILSCEVFEDDFSVTKTVRSSQALGMAVGGLAFGGVGAVIGGLSGAQKTAGNVRKIDLRIVVNDINQPTYDIPFLSIETKKGGIVHGDASEKARFWAGLLSIAIKQADQACNA